MNGGKTVCGVAKFGYNLTVVFPLRFEIGSSAHPLDEERFKTNFLMALKSDQNCQISDASCARPLNITTLEFSSRRERSGGTSFNITVRSIINTGSHPFFNSGTPRFLYFDCKLKQIGDCVKHREYYLLCEPLNILLPFGQSTRSVVAYVAFYSLSIDPLTGQMHITLIVKDAEQLCFVMTPSLRAFESQIEKYHLAVESINEILPRISINFSLKCVVS